MLRLTVRKLLYLYCFTSVLIILGLLNYHGEYKIHESLHNDRIQRKYSSQNVKFVLCLQ